MRLVLPAIALACTAAPLAAQSKETTFFITSTGTGTGADLGGLAGADAHCTKLATAAGLRPHTWRAYLSAQARDGQPAVNARDRIGPGPWRNAKAVLIASDVSQLHSSTARLSKGTSLTERGEVVNGRGDTPNRHDILTGSTLEGRVVPGDGDSTCRNWTSGAAEGSAMVGHHDRQGGGANPTSWNSAHPSRGCGQAQLQASGGDGLFYCFAAD